MQRAGREWTKAKDWPKRLPATTAPMRNTAKAMNAKEAREAGLFDGKGMFQRCYLWCFRGIEGNVINRERRDLKMGEI